MAGTHHINTDLPNHVTKTPKGTFKYQRRVPPDLQEAIGRKVWDYALGSNPDAAYKRATVYEDEHDALIASLATPGDRSRFTDRTANEAGAKLASLAIVMDKHLGADETGVDVNSPVWRQTEERMKSARALPAAAERERLALFAAYAFGDRSYTERVAADDAFGNMLIDHLTPARPIDVVQASIFDALKGALDARLSQIEPADDPAKGMRLTALIAAYSKHRATRPNTLRSYTNKVGRLVDFAKDHPLPHYDAAILRDYRDYLISGDPDAKPRAFLPVKPITIQQYFAPLKALWKWAGDEYPDLKGLAFPNVSLPKNGETVEETRWQAFDENQIKRVWGLVNAAWGEGVKSKVAPERRKAFLMAVRVLLYTGMRPAEVFHIGAGDVRDGVLTIRYTKTKTTRKIPLASAIADFPDFLAEGGFAAAMGKETPTGLAGSMSESFAKIIRTNGFTNDRHVLYSLKDTLIDRLQRQGASDDVMRGIIGHVTGGGKLRRYKTPFGQSPHGMAAMREALNAVSYS